MVQKIFILIILVSLAISECIQGNCQNGKGTYTWANNGGQYVEEWKDGKRHGHGTHTFSGLKYVGEWKDGQIYGHGTYTYAKGQKYVGEWENGQKAGWGILTKPNGTSQIGIWFSDNFVEEKTFSEVINYLKAKYPESEILKKY